MSSPRLPIADFAVQMKQFAQVSLSRGTSSAAISGLAIDKTVSPGLTSFVVNKPLPDMFEDLTIAFVMSAILRTALQARRTLSSVPYRVTKT